jgi:hypothetical protein
VPRNRPGTLRELEPWFSGTLAAAERSEAGSNLAFEKLGEPLTGDFRCGGERGLKPQASRNPRFTREIAAIACTTASFQNSRVKFREVPRNAKKVKKRRKTVARSSPKDNHSLDLLTEVGTQCERAVVVQLLMTSPPDGIAHSLYLNLSSKFQSFPICDVWKHELCLPNLAR